MGDIPRGVIRNREYATQIRDFSNMKFGNITPTDIDMFIEYKNSCFVFVETKFKNATMPFGQKLAFERLADACNKVKPTLFIVASHSAPGDIDFANCTVTQYRSNTLWHTPSSTMTVKNLINYYLGKLTEAKHGKR